MVCPATHRLLCDVVCLKLPPQEKALLVERARYSKLKDDFQYNLTVRCCVLFRNLSAALQRLSHLLSQLLEGRDRDISELEAKLSEITTSYNMVSAQNASMKVEMQRIQDACSSQLDSVKQQCEAEVTAAAEAAQFEKQSLLNEIERLRAELTEKSTGIRSLQAAKESYEHQLTALQAEVDELEVQPYHAWNTMLLVSCRSVPAEIEAVAAAAERIAVQPHSDGPPHGAGSVSAFAAGV